LSFAHSLEILILIELEFLFMIASKLLLFDEKMPKQKIYL